MHIASMILITATLLSTVIAGLIPTSPGVARRYHGRAHHANYTRPHVANHANRTHHGHRTNHTAQEAHVARDNDDYPNYGAWAEEQHKWYRRYHNLNYVHWDKDLAAKAAILANTCKYHHVMDIGGGGYGQNIAFSGSSAYDGYEDPVNFLVTHTNWWYFEYPAYKNFYGLKSPPLPEGKNKFLHYTEMVWASTTSIGCHTAFCHPSKAPPGDPTEMYLPSFYTVCNYGPPGNILGSFDSNVFQQDPASLPVQHYPYTPDV